jgi:hypothetical protein
MTGVPQSKAISGRDAAGLTTADVPIVKKRSQISAARIAEFKAASGRYSPNHTTEGRSIPPQEHTGIFPEN